MERKISVMSVTVSNHMVLRKNKRFPRGKTFSSAGSRKLPLRYRGSFPPSLGEKKTKKVTSIAAAPREAELKTLSNALMGPCGFTL